MNGNDMHLFLLGASAMASLTGALFFLRFWRTTKDLLFLLFALAFGVLAINWTLRALAHPTEETQHYYYVLRLIAFGLIIAAVVHKNRTRGHD